MKKYIPLGFILIAALAISLLQPGLGSSAPNLLPGESGSIEKTQPINEPKQRGVCWVGGPSVVSEKNFLPLVKNHVNWIHQTPFGWQRDIDSPEVRISHGKYSWWGERDIGIETTTALAKKYHIKTLLKPHLWITRPSPGKWRADIKMNGETDWKRWFQSYSEFILHYARLAEKNQIEMLCIGTELQQTVREKPDEWRKLIRQIRKVYHGKLTYAANWYREFEEVPFWDQLDYIGIQAYFPLTNRKHPSVEELQKGWQPYLRAIEKVQRKFNKPVIFTEIGYKSKCETATRPWEWIRPFTGSPDKEDFRLQANCYEAFFRTFWDKEWFSGVYFWKWFPNTDRVVGGINQGFTPQHKPAEKVLSDWFGRVGG